MRVFAALNAVMEQQIDEYYKRRAELEQQDLSAIQAYIKELGSIQALHKSLVMHSALASAITERTNSSAFRESLEVNQSLFVRS